MNSKLRIRLSLFQSMSVNARYAWNGGLSWTDEDGKGDIGDDGCAITSMVVVIMRWWATAMVTAVVVVVEWNGIKTRKMTNHRKEREKEGRCWFSVTPR